MDQKMANPPGQIAMNNFTPQKLMYFRTILQYPN